MKEDVNSLKIVEEGAKTTSAYWQKECTGAKEELIRINNQLTQCRNDLEEQINEY
jgi:hypothetical protein